MKRGDVWWAKLPAPVGQRPVVLLSRNAAYAVRASVTVAPVTRTVHGIPVEVSLGPEEGLPESCVVNLDSVLTIPKRTLERPIGSLPPHKVIEVDQALRFALGLR
jgi:mRNA interferase MazF